MGEIRNVAVNVKRELVFTREIIICFRAYVGGTGSVCGDRLKARLCVSSNHRTIRALELKFADKRFDICFKIVYFPTKYAT